MIASGDIATTNADRTLLIPQKGGAQSWTSPTGALYYKKKIDDEEWWVNHVNQHDRFQMEANEEKKAESGGGGEGGADTSGTSAGSIMNVGTPGGTVIPGTYEGGSGGSVGLLQISPGAVNWNPQVGNLNPLADPNQFYANLAPIQMPQEQRYIDPSLMLLA